MLAAIQTEIRAERRQKMAREQQGDRKCSGAAARCGGAEPVAAAGGLAPPGIDRPVFLRSQIERCG